MTTVFVEWLIAMFSRGSLLLAAALVASWLFGRRHPSGVSAWHRVMIVGLFVLPYAVFCALTTSSGVASGACNGERPAKRSERPRP